MKNSLDLDGRGLRQEQNVFARYQSAGRGPRQKHGSGHIALTARPLGLPLDRKSTRLNSSHSIHDALPIWVAAGAKCFCTISISRSGPATKTWIRPYCFDSEAAWSAVRSEEHTSELQSLHTRRSSDLGCGRSKMFLHDINQPVGARDKNMDQAILL